MYPKSIWHKYWWWMNDFAAWYGVLKSQLGVEDGGEDGLDDAGKDDFKILRAKTVWKSQELKVLAIK